VSDRPADPPDRRGERGYVIAAISSFLDGSARRRDWDDFTSRPLRDAELDRIRLCAAAVDLPLDGEGVATLRALIDQAELVPGDDPEGREPWRVEIGMIAGLLAGAVLWWVNYLPGAGFFHNLHLIVVPPALGAFVVMARNGRKGIGAYDPRIVARNRQGRV
jgi:hypothetical protein